MCEALAGRNVRVSLYSSNVARDDRLFSFKSPDVLDVPLDRPVEVNGVSIHYFPTRWPHRFAFSPPMMRRLRQTIQEFDLVHIHSLYVYPTLIAAHYARQFRVPYLIRPHGTLHPYLRRRRRFRKALYHAAIERRNLDHAAAIHYTSIQEMRAAESVHLGARGIVIPLGIAPVEFANLPPRGKFRERHPQLRHKRLVVFLGRLTRVKGLDLLIPAVASVIRQIDDVHLVIAGPDDEGYGAVLSGLLAQAGIDKHTTRVGMLHGQEKLELLVDTDVWVLPSRMENFGMAVVEAMACGLPVVISDQVDIHHEVRSANAGLIVACKVDEIAAALARLLRNPSLGSALGGAARQLVKSRFGWEAVTDQLLTTYLEIVRTRASKDPNTMSESISEANANVRSS
jgi:glycosyltransferase involved in cell wall biosynthesis